MNNLDKYFEPNTGLTWLVIEIYNNGTVKLVCGSQMIIMDQGFIKRQFKKVK